MDPDRVVTIEGVIGCGKSTLLRTLQDRYANQDSVVFVTEPVDQWEELKDPETGLNFLQMYYRDQKRHAFAFQVNAYLTRLSAFLDAVRQAKESGAKTIVTERCLKSDYMIFAKMLATTGDIEPVHYKVYQGMYESHRSLMDGDVVHVFLSVDPEVAQQRIARRQREGEAEIPLDYLNKLGELHSQWMATVDSNALIMIDANRDLNSDSAYWKECIAKVSNAIDNPKSGK